MSLRLSVTYPATDGSMPESVELEWQDAIPPARELLPLLNRLLTAPAERLADTRAESAPERLWSEVTCCRAACDHPRRNHIGRGVCSVCGGDRCPSYVDPLDVMIGTALTDQGITGDEGDGS